LMRVVLDGRIILPRMSGAGRYVVELARRLPPLDPTLRLDVVLLPVLQRTGVPRLLEDAGARVVYCAARVLTVRQWVAIPRLLRRIRPDLYHYPHFDLPAVPVPSVVTIYDLNPALLPGYFTRQPTLRRWVAHRLVRSTLRRCRIALVISETVRELLERHFSEGRGKAQTIRLGVDPTHWSAASDSGAEAEPLGDERRWRSRPYVLYVGVERPHKNLIRLVRAFARFHGSGQWSQASAPYLWLAGVGAGSRQLRGELQRLGCAESVRLTDALTEPLLIRAYRGARVVAYVSTSEGFGLPILEALAGQGVQVRIVARADHARGIAVERVVDQLVAGLVGDLVLVARPGQEVEHACGMLHRIGEFEAMKLEGDLGAGRQAAARSRE